MLNDEQCKFCGSRDQPTINSYKHHWFCCNDCGNIVRKRKDKYLLQSLFPDVLVAWLTQPHESKWIRQIAKFLPHGEIIQEGSTIYDYFGKVLRNGVAGTKYENEWQFYEKIFVKHHIDIKDKKILDISGGPGFFTKNLSENAQRAVMTEYNQTSVELAKEILGIEAYRFDLNTDTLDAIFDEPFDVILMRGACINFCNDLDTYLESLKQIMHPDTIVYVTHCPAKLGPCLQWQLDDYTYNYLFNPETIVRAFTAAGFRVSGQKEIDCQTYPYILNILERFLLYPYKVRAMLARTNRQLTLKTLQLIFKLR